MNPNERLSILKGEEFDYSISLTSSPRQLRSYLRANEVVQTLKKEVASGQLSETGINGFLSEILDAFRPGRRFAFEIALCALVVVLEDHFANFAERFLSELASLRLSEVTLAKRLALLCLEERVKSKTRVYDSRSNWPIVEIDTVSWSSTDKSRKLATLKKTVYATA